ncbi:MAG TPA: type VI secretion system tip protein TssI/VgrG [Polyangiaceae bacterium]|nr:type VI secretion system tip protein TssI/VgrG [Polyangiaceae bacterium]
MVRIAEVSSVLGEGELLLLSMRGAEALGKPFQYVVELLSESSQLDFGSLLGQPMTISLTLADQSQREFNGLVTDFAIVGGLGRYVRYRAVLRPWLWLMSKRTNCRIFQRRNVPTVVRELFREHGFADFEERLTETARYKELEYLVQYRESDLNFVMRILEHEGIYFYFRHEGGKHILVLADSYSAHEPARGAAEIPYFPPQQGQRRESDHVDGWSCSRHIRSGAFVGRDFDFKKPSAAITPSYKNPQEHAHADYELFDYPADFLDAGTGDQRVRMRLEEVQADHETVEATGNVRALNAGHLFTLSDFPREDQNKEHLVTAVTYELEVNGYESSTSVGSELAYRVRLEAIDSKRPFHPARVTPKPVVEGPQTAIVRGEKNQDIWTDEFGRVKVQFHWDRVGKNDENSSCWIRVSQLWAGSGFGGVHLPRIGQEVIVDFLEGDPDRPIITGRVYNQDNKPPYKLPDNATQSGIKSRSSLKGAPSNFNEIRFEDLKGREELYVQAEKDQNTLVKNNQSITVGVNQTISVGANQTISVGANQAISVGATRTLNVTKADTEHFKDTRTTNVDKTDTLTITGKHTGTYDGERHETVKTLDKTEVNGKKETIVHGTYDVTADTHFKVVQGANSLLIEKKIAGVSEGPVSFTNGPCEIKLEGGKIMLTAAEEISLVCGGASIKLTKSGAVEIAGAQKVSLGSGPSAVAVEPAGANVSGPKIGAHAIGMHEISGALVKIN